MSERTLIVAVTNTLVRGFMVVPTDRKSRSGEPVGGLYAVARGIARALAFKTPARAVAIIDDAAPGAAWPALVKAQLPLLQELLETMGIPVVVAPDEHHAVASYTAAALAAGDDVVIVGMDKRYAQLVSERVWWYDANKDARYTPDIVRKRFGVGPALVAEWLGLVGDDDALPGVAGIGAKGATTLLETYGSVERALAARDDIKGRLGNALRSGLETIPIELGRARLQVDRALPRPLAELPFAPAPTGVRNALFDRLGFVELLAADAEAAPAVTVCDTPEAVAAALPRLGTAPVVVVPLFEDTGTIAGLALQGERETIYVPEVALVASWLADPSVPKLGHDLKAAAASTPIAGVVGDSQCASHLTQPSNWAPHDLPTVAKHVLGRALPPEDGIRGVGRARKPWSALPPERAAAFAARHADACAGVWRALSPEVAPALMAEYLALSETCVRMEQVGIGVDAAELDGVERDFAVIEDELQAQIDALAGHTFNIGSSKQLGTVLFDELKLPVVSKTKTGWSTAIDALERIEHAHPIVPLVIRWRLLRRLRDSWITALRSCIGPDGRVHSRVHPARSFSGRLVNTNPDLGRVPGRTPEMKRIRRAFVARPGYLLLSVDYNQLGLHVLAHLTKDPALVEPLRERDDMHSLTAAAVLEKPRAALTEAERQIGKVVNFATFAGQGPSALALQLNITPAEAKDLIARFDRRYAGVRAFQDRQSALAHERGYIETLAGRRWPIGGLESLDPHDSSYAERMTRRATHEGSVSDVARRGLLDADRALGAAGLDAPPLAQILDEVLFEVPADRLMEAAHVAAEAMRHAFELEVPLRVGLEAGPNWADLAPLPEDT